MTKGLSKQNLIDWGIKEITINEDGSYTVIRKWKKVGHSTKVVERAIKESNFTCKHKYASAKIYKGFAISVNGVTKAIMTSRLVYAWFKGDIPDGYDVDHIDNNPLNNSLDNLQLLTRQENLAKRFCDNPNACNNQHTWIKKHSEYKRGL